VKFSVGLSEMRVVGGVWQENAGMNVQSTGTIRMRMSCVAKKNAIAVVATSAIAVTIRRSRSSPRC